MSVVIGLGIAHDSVRAVVRRRRQVVWHAEEQAREGYSVATRRIMDRMPKRWRNRARVRVAVGPSHCQVRALTGVPANARPAAVAQIADTGAERFFLQDGAPLITSEAEWRNGQWWVAALPRPLVDEIRQALEGYGLASEAWEPTMAVLNVGLRADRLVWPDGPVTARLDVQNGEWTSFARVRTSECDRDVAGDAVPELAAIDHGERRWADAFGAAFAMRTRLTVRPQSAASRKRRAFRSHLVLAVLVTVSATAMAAAPGLADWYVGIKAGRTIDSLQTGARSVARVEHELRSVSSDQAVIARFLASRQSFAQLLGALTSALPESTAVVSLTADSSGGSAVLLSLRGAQVLASLSSVPALDGLQIIGPISTQTVGGVPLQRIAVRFRRRAVNPGQSRPQTPIARN